MSPGNLWNWFGKLDDLQRPLYFSITSTWGGGARGTECDLLEFEVNKNSQRHFYILNGQVTIVTNYTKTRSHHGRGRQVARTIPWQLARLVILIYAVVYPTAARLGPYVFESTKAEPYTSYMFVLRGKAMDSPQFSKALISYTEQHLDIGLGLRDYRQVMSTILINITKADFGVPDAEDHDLKLIHEQFAHSRATGEHNYALQLSDALTEISHTAVASMQRVSILYHATIGLLHPNSLRLQSNQVFPSSCPLLQPKFSLLYDLRLPQLQDVQTFPK
jgi:hypothetical protein